MCLTNEQGRFLYNAIKYGTITKILFGFKIFYKQTVIKLYRHKVIINHYSHKGKDIKLFYDKCKERYNENNKHI